MHPTEQWSQGATRGRAQDFPVPTDIVAGKSSTPRVLRWMDLVCRARVFDVCYARGFWTHPMTNGSMNTMNSFVLAMWVCVPTACGSQASESPSAKAPQSPATPAADPAAPAADPQEKSAAGLPEGPLPDRDPALAQRLVRDHGAVLLDVRSQSEFAEGHVEGATLIPHDSVEARIDEVVALAGGDRSRPVVVYCQSGGRAGKAKQTLLDQGFTRVTNMGGYSDWPASE